MARNRNVKTRGFRTPAALARRAAALFLAAALAAVAPAHAQTASQTGQTQTLPDLVADPVSIVYAVHSSSLLNLILPEAFRSANSNMWLYDGALDQLAQPNLTPSKEFAGLVGKVRYRVNHADGNNSTYFEVFISPAFAQADYAAQSIKKEFPVKKGAAQTALVWIDKSGRQFLIECWNDPMDDKKPPHRTVCQAWEEGTQTIVKTVINAKPAASREAELDSLRDSFDMIRIARETLVQKIYAGLGVGTIQKL